jgi:RNA polymerase sigma-70 factor (ECF subfamily)
VTHLLTSDVTNQDSPANSPRDEFDAREARLRALMLQAQAGDAAAYRALLTDLSERLRAFYRRRLASIAVEVEDLVQETLIAIHNQRHTYDANRPLTAWCYAIARYKLVDLLRRRGRHEALTDSLDDANELLTAQDHDAADATRDVQQLLDTLPPRQRLAVMHVKIDGRSVAETASLTGMSQSAVKVNVHRALKTLAARVREAT